MTRPEPEAVWNEVWDAIGRMRDVLAKNYIIGLGDEIKVRLTAEQGRKLERMLQSSGSGATYLSYTERADGCFRIIKMEGVRFEWTLTDTTERTSDMPQHLTTEQDFEARKLAMQLAAGQHHGSVEETIRATERYYAFLTGRSASDDGPKAVETPKAA